MSGVARLFHRLAVGTSVLALFGWADRGTTQQAPVQLDLTTEDLAPYSMTVGDGIGGMVTLLLKTALERLEIRYTIKLYPWARAYDLTLADPHGCLYSTRRTPKREPLFKWVGPVARFDWVAFVLAGSSVDIHDFADLKRYRTVAPQGDALGEYLQQKGAHVEVMPVTEPLKMLVNGHIDYWATSSRRGRYEAAQAGVSLRAALPLETTDMYLACNPHVPDSVIVALNSTLKAMQSDGSAEAISRSFP